MPYIRKTLAQIKLVYLPYSSRELHILKNLQNQDTKSSEHCEEMVMFSSLGNSVPEEPGGSKILHLDQRPSKLFFVRDFMPFLYKAILNIWTSKDEYKKIVLTGNSGIGKSWFQFYLLHRLLQQQESESKSQSTSQESPASTHEGLSAPYQFVVRQVGKDQFFLFDLKSCHVWGIAQGNSPFPLTVEVTKLLDTLRETLYFFEPELTEDLAPLGLVAPSISTLSPYPKRLRHYLKLNPHVLYMPVRSYNELFLVAKRENMNQDLLDNNYYMFGGIIRHTMQKSQIHLKRFQATLEAQCGRAPDETLRSIEMGADEDTKAEDRATLSGFLASYNDIPYDGDLAFQQKNLTTTSSYARVLLEHRLSFVDPEQHAHGLLKFLDGGNNDLTGKDLEVSVVHILAAGLPWEYQAVGANEARTRLALTKRSIDRSSEFAEFIDSKISYPRKTTFALADCFFVCQERGNAVVHAFQITSQYSHPFKLREKVGIGVKGTLNLYFVSPKHAKAYRNRIKDMYLAMAGNEDMTRPF